MPDQSMDPSSYPRDRRTRQLSQRQEEILTTALRIFAAKGYRAATLGDIASELSFTQAGLYYYFDSKQEMLSILVLRPTELLIHAIDAVAELNLDASDKLRRAIAEHIRILSEHADLFRVMLREQIELPSGDLQELSRLNRVYHTKFTELIIQGVQCGDLSTNKPSIASLFVIGGLNWLLQWYNPYGSLSGSDIAALYGDFVMTGLKGD